MKTSLLIVMLIVSSIAAAQQSGRMEKESGRDVIRPLGLESHMQSLAKGTAIDYNTVYDVPLVFHVLYDYNVNPNYYPYIPDSAIINTVADMNLWYSATNPITVPLVPPYNGNIPGTNILYRGNPKIRFHLAAKDPNGNPTKGITRIKSFQANIASDHSKLDQWPPDKYYNIWVAINLAGGLYTYALYPDAAAVAVQSDGIMTVGYSTLSPNFDQFLSSFMARALNVKPSGAPTSPLSPCYDDGVDDTPPIKGLISSNCSAPNLYDTTCSPYSVTYTKAQLYQLYGDSTLPTTIDYPDTVNVQNITNYWACPQMFTYGQVTRLRTALTSNIANRNHLITQSNLYSTGITDAASNLLPLPDLPVIVDASVNRQFICADGETRVSFKNRSWNDTITAASWTFGNNATRPGSLNPDTVYNVAFSTPGWVDIWLSELGNGTGLSSAHFKHLVYAADTIAIQPDSGYQQSFDGADTAQWPIFNYYESDHKWKLSNAAGYKDNTSIEFANYDPRGFNIPANQTQTAQGLYADFFSRAFDLGQGNDYNLSFAYAGTTKSLNPSEMNDRLEVAYSDDCGLSWNTMPGLTLAKNELANNGYTSGPFVPVNANQWAWKSASLTGLYDKNFFRFRYYVGSNNMTDQLGTGNNFFIDKIAVNNWALNVDPAVVAAQGMVVSPNPTNGSATILIKGNSSKTATVQVHDITGKTVFATQVKPGAGITKVPISAESLAVKGFYFVTVNIEGTVITQKLVVY